MALPVDRAGHRPKTAGPSYWHTNGQAGTPIEGVIAAILGMVVVGSVAKLSVSGIVLFVRRMIAPLVTEIVVVTGLTQIMVGLVSTGSAFVSMSD